jgi:AcrR family transcriptional regulator
MDPKRRAVKGRRPYDASGRRERARRARDAILDAAQARFLGEGYAGSTIAAIAADADVSVDTIYKSFGGKPGLVRAIYERGLAGQGPEHAEARSDALQATESDPHEIMRGLGRFITEVSPRAMPIALLIAEAAAIDPDMAALEQELDDQRLERMTHNARNLRQAGHLRPDLTVEHAGLLMWSLTSPSLYRMNVVRRRWSIQRHADFITATMSAALLPPPG